MSDDAPDPIAWQESGIIIKQLVLIIVSVGSLCGVAFTPQITAMITSIVTSVFVIGFAAWTIHGRLTKPCPPISNGENK